MLKQVEKRLSLLKMNNFSDSKLNPLHPLSLFEVQLNNRFDMNVNLEGVELNRIED